MRSFANSRNRPRVEVSHGRAGSRTERSGPDLHGPPLPHPRQTVGNQAALRRLRALAAIQTKLAIGGPGDEYEQEADLLAEQVMRSPAPDLGRACPCGGGCLDCQAKPRGQTHERLQTRRNQASDRGRVAAPSIVQEALASPGHPLDLSTRAFMERRFGFDLGEVRVHADAEAADSANAIGALAYTVAPDIVFGAGQYAPHTTAGRKLLAHELTHVIQPQVGQVIRRRPEPQASRAPKSDAWLQELAEQPDQAHRAWKRLTSLQKMAVVARMTHRYGDEFAKSFLSYTEHPIEPMGHHYGPGFPEHTPAWFQARGYRLWKRSSVNEFWVHPSGKTIMQILDQGRGPRAATAPQVPEATQPPPEDCTDLAELTVSILSSTISLETSVKEDLEGTKARLERMDRTTDDYGRQYDDYVETLRAMKSRIESALEDIGLMRLSLVQASCGSGIDDQLWPLLELQNWVEFESSPFLLEFLEPIKLTGPIFRPQDEE